MGDDNRRPVYRYSHVMYATNSFLDSLIIQLRETPKTSVLLVTHLLPDKLPMIDALSRIAEIGRILPVPYSRDLSTIERVRQQGLAVSEATLEELMSPVWTYNTLRDTLEISPYPVVVCEGGYFAPILARLSLDFPEKLLGVVEDTEAGHRRYDAVEPLGIPVVSVARSSLKQIEDRLIGESVAFSLEKIFREKGTPLTGARITILGYGKIGSSCAASFRRRGCDVAVWDIAPSRRACSLADGFRSPGRQLALSWADVVVGASGAPSLTDEDLPSLRDRCILASASSKRVEFSVTTDRDERDGVITSIRRPNGAPILLLNRGEPINFVDRAVVGPVLSLIQGELLLAIARLAQESLPPGLQELDNGSRELIAQLWLDSHVDDDGRLSRRVT